MFGCALLRSYVLRNFGSLKLHKKTSVGAGPIGAILGGTLSRHPWVKVMSCASGPSCARLEPKPLSGWHIWPPTIDRILQVGRHKVGIRDWGVVHNVAEARDQMCAVGWNWRRGRGMMPF